jgi:V/A-type H+/Na+-transporting ATPase subunit D
MAAKIKLTRPELKRHRDAIARYERYTPMLKLKQQQLQMRLREVAGQRRELEQAVEEAVRVFASYETVLSDPAGLSPRRLAEPLEVRTSRINVAGVEIPFFEEVVFPNGGYSLFGTPAWVDQAVADLQEISRRQARLDVLIRQERLLERELVRITQRVNLFEKVKIPQSREAIRVIRIWLGDELTASVARGKIAKAKLAERRWPEAADLKSESELESPQA